MSVPLGPQASLLVAILSQLNNDPTLQAEAHTIADFDLD